MVVEVGLEAHVLRHLNHLVDIALAVFEKAVELGFFQPLRVVGKPREKGMVVVIDLILGSFAERFGDVTVEIKILHLVAQVPEVKVSLQLLDSNETLWQLRVVIGVPRGTLGCGLLDQSVYLVLILCQGFRYLFDFPAGEVQLVLHPQIRLLAGVVSTEGGRWLYPLCIELVHELVSGVFSQGEGIVCEGGEDLRDSRLPRSPRVRYEGGGEVLSAFGEGERVFHVVVWGNGVPFPVRNLHLEAGQKLSHCFRSVVCHSAFLSIGSRCLAPNNNLLRGRGAPVSARPFGER